MATTLTDGLDIRRTANGFLVVPAHEDDDGEPVAAPVHEAYVFTDANDLAAWLVTYYAEAA